MVPHDISADVIHLGGRDPRSARRGELIEIVVIGR
jgi:hypothetical protein